MKAKMLFIKINRIIVEDNKDNHFLFLHEG